MKKRLDHGFGTPTSFSRAHDCEFEPCVRGTSSRRKRAVTAANRKNDPQPSADARGQRRNFGSWQLAVGSRQSAVGNTPNSARDVTEPLPWPAETSPTSAIFQPRPTHVSTKSYVVGATNRLACRGSTQNLIASRQMRSMPISSNRLTRTYRRKKAIPFGEVSNRGSIRRSPGSCFEPQVL
jgi:hypothetical protein